MTTLGRHKLREATLNNKYRIFFYAKSLFLRCSPRNLLLAILAAVVLSGCSGEGGGDNGGPVEDTGNEKVTLSGVATDDPINGGTVSVKDSNGTQLCSATTDAQGHYSCVINKEALASGVTVEVTGGSLNGTPFVGRLEAIYGSGDPANAANLTLVTTLVSKVAATDAGSTLISRREAALQRLTDISLFGREEWNAPEPSSVGLPALRHDVATSGLNTVMDALIADLLDNDLSADNMQYFPKAHGGIVQLLLSGGDSQSRIDALPGDAVRAKVVSSLTGGSDVTVGYEKIAGPEALTIDPTTGEVRITLSDVMADGETINFTVRASTAGGYRNIAGKIIAHATQTVLEQLASGSQQVITDDFGRFVVEVPTNDTLPAGTKIRLRSFTNSEGHPVFRLDTDQPPAEGRSLLLRLADPDIFSSGEQGAVAGPVTAPMTRQQADSQVQGWELAPATAQTELCPGTANIRWRALPGYFTSAGFENTRLATLAVIRDFSGLDFKTTSSSGDEVILKDASVLCSTELMTAPDLRDREPVLFVHGFNIGNGLGGKGTWGQFLEIAKNWKIGRGVVPFQFRWNTNARYQTVAGDLKRAVEDINRATGRRVHIVAHSFGGLLVRTYLQGLAENASGSVYTEYDPPVASLTTVGTPHSGIGPGMRDGSAGSLAASCNQASCFQAGLETDESTFTNYQQLYKTFSRKEIIDALNNGGHAILPAGLPVNVLIGLRSTLEVGDDKLSEGDGLIGYWGQRWRETDRNFPLRRAYQDFGGDVTERIIGAPEELRGPNVIGTIIGDDFGGYKHSSLTTNFGGVGIKYLEVDVNEKNHATVVQVENWIESHTASPIVGTSASVVSLK